MMPKSKILEERKYKTSLLHRILYNFMFFFFSQMSAAIWLISLILPKLKIYNLDFFIILEIEQNLVHKLTYSYCVREGCPHENG